MVSIFTKIIKGEILSYKIAEDENYCAFLDAFPVVEGHTLVVPKKEIDNIFDLDDKTVAGLMVFAKKIAIAIEKAIDCKRVGIQVIGTEVPHAHIHLLPFNKETEVNIIREKLKLSKQEFENIQTKIKNAINF